MQVHALLLPPLLVLPKQANHHSLYPKDDAAVCLLLRGEVVKGQLHVAPPMIVDATIRSVVSEGVMNGIVASDCAIGKLSPRRMVFMPAADGGASTSRTNALLGNLPQVPI